MPYRHEFEIDFNNDAENLVAHITFSDDDTEDTMLGKIEALMSYNAQLTERRFRTKIVEDFSLQYQEVRAVKGEKDELRVLGGGTPAERRIDARLIPLAPYMGAERIGELATEVHRGIRVVELIKDRRVWEQQGIQTHQEGHLFSDMMALVRDGRVPASEYDRWNDTIERSNRVIDHPSQKTALLIGAERELCQRERIDAHLYQAVKDVIIREYAFRGRLSRMDAVAICPSHGRTLGATYDLMLAHGWITA
jgi:transcriptional adapter 2-alpha